MTVKILKAWHQWSWAFHIAWTGIIIMTYVFDYKNSMANNTKDIAILVKQHDEENMKQRMAVQENTTEEVNRRLAGIELVQGKIFDRINQIGDRDRK